MISSLLLGPLTKLLASSVASGVVNSTFESGKDSDDSMATFSASNNNNSTYISALSTKSKLGFELIIQGVNKRNEESLYLIEKGVNLIKNKYTISSDLVHDIVLYIKNSDMSEKDMFELKINKIHNYIAYLLSDPSINNRIERYLSKKNTSIEEHNECIYNIYSPIIKDKNNRKYTTANGVYNNKIKSYTELLNESGNIYDNLIKYYVSLGCIDDPDKYNHIIAYEIAGFIISYTDYYFCRNIDQTELASDITNHIFKYLHERSIAPLFDNNIDKYDTNIDRLYDNYLKREIKYYPAFLEICCRLYDELIVYELTTLNGQMHKDKNDILRSMIDRLFLNKFDFLYKTSKDDLFNDIKLAYNEYKFQNNCGK